MRGYGGAVYDHGAFKLHNFGSAYFWDKVVGGYFPSYKNKYNFFGFDWMARQYAISKGGNLILMFDPATGEAYELEQSLIGFFNIDLVEYREETLALDIFNRLEYLHKNKLGYNECLGFKKPLFLGGIDKLENYELTEMEVYWELSYQIYCKVKGLPLGTIVKSISID
ncbi:hypothetical protein GCM10009122_42350 [Fulvivirga kasyanovii]